MFIAGVSHCRHESGNRRITHGMTIPLMIPARMVSMNVKDSTILAAKDG
jgi:hypothetical protein